MLSGNSGYIGQEIAIKLALSYKNMLLNVAILSVVDVAKLEAFI